MKTIICDIDGTLVKYTGEGHLGIMNRAHELLPGVRERIRRWEAQGHRIILITGRRESIRERTESELRRLGIPFDMLLMGYADEGRFLINDLSHNGKVKGYAVNVERDKGWNNYDWPSIGLDNPL